MTKTISRLTCTVLFCLCFVASATAQDFERSYRIGENGSINIRNVSGSIIITGYDGDAVTISGIKEGRDRELVSVEDASSGNAIDLSVKYPRECNCDASVRFEVRVPRSVRYDFSKVSTASGDISVRGVRGRVRVNTASGDVVVEDVSGDINAATASGDLQVREAVGAVTASSASGDVDVEISRLEGSENMKFSTASGDVSVKLPSALDADVYLSTMSGKLTTTFPLEVQERRHGSGSWAEGKLGGASRSLRITSASGNVTLTGR